VDDRQLGLRSASDHGHDPVADYEALDTRTNCPHDARELEARDVRRPTWWSRVQTGPLQQVGAIEARGLDTYEQFASPRDRIGPFSHEDGARLDDDGTHCRKRTRGNRRARQLS
jgi:hypothetical protein